jgi:signal transduction histidine kinase
MIHEEINIFLKVSFLLSAFFALGLGVFVYLKGPKKPTNTSFLEMSVFFSFWIFTNFLTGLYHSFFLSRLTHAAGAFVTMGAIIFSRRLSNLEITRKQRAFYLTVMLVFAFLPFTKLCIKNIASVTLGSFEGEYGVLFPLWAAYLVFSIGYSIFLLVKLYRSSQGYKKMQVKYVGFGLIATGVTCIILDVILPFLGNKRLMVFDSISALFYLLATAYAIIKYRLMDIRVAITRAGIFIIVYALTLGFPFWIGYQTRLWPLATSLMALLAMSGPIVHRLLQRKAESVLMAEQKRYQKVLLNAAKGMVREHNLDRLTRLIVHVVRKAVRLDFVVAFVIDKEKQCYRLRAVRDHHKIPETAVFYSDHPLITTLKQRKRPIFYGEAGDLPVTPTTEGFPFKPVHLIIPSFIEDNLLGFLILGEKQDRTIYSQSDIDVFRILSHQAALAIENSLVVEETKETQARLFQAEKLASIGGMADGVAHQMKNRLNHFSIASGEAQFEIVDFINKHPGLIEENPDLKNTLDYLNKIAESLIINVQRTNSVIQGILNYARVEEKDTFFSTFSLQEILDLSLEVLKVKHEITDFPLTVKIKDGDQLYGVRAQIMESIYNILDNCYEAIQDKVKNYLNDQEREAFVPHIELGCVNNGSVSFLTISDNGIGIKEEDQRKIFAPFFTTKSSYKSGSGIGMYVVKRMIEENHKGRVRFESAYLQGTTFTIELPYKPAEVASQ